MKRLAIFVALATAAPAFAGVSVNAPVNNSNVASTVQYVAKATTSCAKGISAIGIYTAPNVLAYTVNGSSLNTLLNLSPGTYNTVVQAWDNCGGVEKMPITIFVKGNASEVQVMAPTNNAKVSTQVQFLATANSSCPQGVSAMGIYTSPGVLSHKVSGANVNTVLTLNPGNYNTVVQEWDNCGGSAKTPVSIAVAGQHSGGSVQVTAPLSNSTVSPTVQFVATATTSCAAGVAAMGIYPSAGALAYKVNGAKLNTLLTLGAGTYHAVVQEWDNCGGTATAPVVLTVASGGSPNGPNGKSGQFANLHQKGGWTGYALLPPVYNICPSCVAGGPQTKWSMSKGVASPSLSGNAAKMDIGGQTVYSDVLWNNHLVGDFSSQGLPDTDRSIIPNVHNFTYDVYFYANDISCLAGSGIRYQSIRQWAIVHLGT